MPEKSTRGLIDLSEEARRALKDTGFETAKNSYLKGKEGLSLSSLEGEKEKARLTDALAREYFNLTGREIPEVDSIGIENYARKRIVNSRGYGSKLVPMMGFGIPCTYYTHAQFFVEIHGSLDED